MNKKSKTTAPHIGEIIKNHIQKNRPYPSLARGTEAIT
jgi:hypothetical protein